MKTYYKSYRIKKYKNSIVWKNDSRLHVGIECNKYFTKEKWLGKLHSVFPKADDYCQIKFYENRYEKYALLPSLDVVCTTWLNRVYIMGAKRLKWIHAMASGTEFLEEIVNLKSIQITSTRGVSSESVAEYVLCVCLALLKKLYYAFSNQQKRLWNQDYFLENDFTLLKTKKIGILGLGNNGRAVARIFKSLGCCVYGCDEEDQKLDFVNYIYASNQLDELIQNSEIIIICLPLTSKTKNLITLRELKLLGNKGILINVARGEIVNESDLIYALRHQIISAAAVDVFNLEPLPRSSRFWKCPNLIVTPHIAGNINNYIDKIQIYFIENLKRFVSKR